MPVIESKKLHERKELTFTLERNILGVPTYVLHAKSSETSDTLKHTWQNSKGVMEYSFCRTSLAPFPQVEHARYFDSLIGLFATRWNPDGYLWFSIAEILRFSGKNPKNGGARKAVLEAIRRYQFCQASWQQSWNGGLSTWVSSFIPESDIWDNDTGDLKRNPRNSRHKEQLHKITFCKHVVTSLKDSHVRVFLTKSLKELKADSYAVYRYFYGFSDKSKVNRKLDSLMTIFPWNGRKSRFQPWLEKRLEECFQKGFIDEYEFKDDRVFVKCKSLREYKDSAPVIEIKNKRKSKKTTIKKILTSNMTDEALLQEYFSRKQAGQIKPEHAETIDMMIAKGQKDLTVLLLRNQLAL